MTVSATVEVMQEVATTTLIVSEPTFWEWVISLISLI
jgi:hypothetical protein